MQSRLVRFLVCAVVISFLLLLAWRQLRQPSPSDAQVHVADKLDHGFDLDTARSLTPPASEDAARHEAAASGVTPEFPASISLAPNWLQGESLTKVTAQLVPVDSGSPRQVEFTDSSWSGSLPGAHRIGEIRRGSDLFAFHGDVVLSPHHPSAEVNVHGVRSFSVTAYDLDTGAPIDGTEVVAVDEAISGLPAAAAHLDGLPAGPPGTVRLVLTGERLATHFLVRAPGYGELEFQRGAFVREMRIPLRRMASLLVNVIAKEDSPATLRDLSIEAVPGGQVRMPDADSLAADSMKTRPGTEFTSLPPGAYDIVLRKQARQRTDRVPIAEQRVVLSPGQRHAIEFELPSGDTQPTFLAINLYGEGLAKESVEGYSLEFSRLAEDGLWRRVPSYSDWEESTPNRGYSCEHWNVPPGQYRVTLYPFGLHREFQLDPGDRDFVDFNVGAPCKVQLTHGSGAPEGICLVLLGFEGQGGAYMTSILSQDSATTLESSQKPTWLRAVSDGAATARTTIFPRPDQPTLVTLEWEPMPSTRLDLIAEPRDGPLDDQFWSQVLVEASSGSGVLLARSILSGDGRPNYEGQVASSASCLMSDPGHYRIEHPTLRGETRTVYVDVSAGGATAVLDLD